jgi:hypothetical protein
MSTLRVILVEGVRSDYLRLSHKEIEHAEAALSRNADILPLELCLGRSSEPSPAPIPESESIRDNPEIVNTVLPNTA